MSQTIKIRTGYSETVSQDYNSKRYSIELEGDVSVNNGDSKTEIDKATQRLFAFCKSIIAREKDNASSTALFDSGDTVKTVAPENTNKPDSQQLASAKQVSYITKLCNSQKLKVEEFCYKNWKKEKVADLTVAEASESINFLKEGAKK